MHHQDNNNTITTSYTMDLDVRMITIRVRVFVTEDRTFPDRVRVVVKQRGAICWPFWRKLASIGLQETDWHHMDGTVWCNEAAVTVPIQLEQLLRRDERQLLALQLYCLCGRTVQHKALGRFTRVMQQMQDGELCLSLHYPGACRPPRQDENTSSLRTEEDRDTGHNEEAATQTQPVEDGRRLRRYINGGGVGVLSFQMLMEHTGVLWAVSVFLILGLAARWWRKVGRHRWARFKYGKHYRRVQKNP